MSEIIPSGEKVVCLLLGLLQGPGIVIGHDTKTLDHGMSKEDWSIYLVRDMNTGRIMEIAADWLRVAGPSCSGLGNLVPDGTQVTCTVSGVLKGPGVVVRHELREVNRGPDTIDRWVVYIVRDTYTGKETEISESWVEPTLA